MCKLNLFFPYSKLIIMWINKSYLKINDIAPLNNNAVDPT